MSRDYLRLLADAVGLGAMDPTPPLTGTVAGADGLLLRYRDWQGDGPDVLLLHGGGLTSHTWDAVCLWLRQAARCVSLDQRGHGDSDWSPTGAYTVDDHARDVRAVVGALGLREPLLVGHSMGGLNALCAVARLGVGASGVVLVDIAPGHSLGPADQLLGKVRGGQARPTLDQLCEQAMRFNRLKDPRLAGYAVAHNLRRDTDGRWAWKHDGAHMAPVLMRRTRASSARLADELGPVKCPITLARGEHSRILTVADAERFAAHAGAELVTVRRAGHNVQGDQPRALAAVLRERLPGLG